MKIAVIGTGISGLASARELYKDHEITIFEAGSYIGGHTNTVTVDSSIGPLNVDTGFIVFNTRTYPNFVKMIDDLDVDWLETNMGFSVSDRDANLEYSGESLNGFFAQRRRLLDPKMYKLCRQPHLSLLR